MGLNRIVDVMLALVSVAAITAVVRAPNSASVIKEFGTPLAVVSGPRPAPKRG